MLGSYCPGSASLRNNISLEIKTCPECGADVELFSIDRRSCAKSAASSSITMCSPASSGVATPSNASVPRWSSNTKSRNESVLRADHLRGDRHVMVMKGNASMAKVKRQIITIDEEKCDGCGQCVPSCAEGALRVVDGKARLMKQSFCDGLGACLGECPAGRAARGRDGGRGIRRARRARLSAADRATDGREARGPSAGARHGVVVQPVAGRCRGVPVRADAGMGRRTTDDGRWRTGRCRFRSLA